jgi:hypothetical protein
VFVIRYNLIPRHHSVRGDEQIVTSDGYPCLLEPGAYLPVKLRPRALRKTQFPECSRPPYAALSA